MRPGIFGSGAPRGVACLAAVMLTVTFAAATVEADDEQVTPADRAAGSRTLKRRGLNTEPSTARSIRAPVAASSSRSGQAVCRERLTARVAAGQATPRRPRGRDIGQGRLGGSINLQAAAPPIV